MAETKIGILGLGSRSTLFYLNELNKQYQAIHKGYSTCPFVLYNTNFNLLNPFLPDNFERLEPQLAAHLKALTALQINYLLIPNITLHQTFDRLKPNITIAHPIHLTAKKLVENKQNKAVVFGSAYTMQATYLKDGLAPHGIELIQATSAEAEFINTFRTKVYATTETVKDVAQFNRLKQKYAADTPVLIACTELSIYSTEAEANIYDMALIQIEETVKKAK